MRRSVGRATCRAADALACRGSNTPAYRIVHKPTFWLAWLSACGHVDNATGLHVRLWYCLFIYSSTRRCVGLSTILLLATERHPDDATCRSVDASTHRTLDVWSVRRVHALCQLQADHLSPVLHALRELWLGCDDGFHWAAGGKGRRGAPTDDCLAASREITKPG
jgi:hypothetical protein